MKKMCLAGVVALAMQSGVVAQMVTGNKIPGYYETLGVSSNAVLTYKAANIGGSAPANVLWPGEKLVLTGQVENLSDVPIAAKGKVDVIWFCTKGRPGDIWTPDMERLGLIEEIPVEINVDAKK